MKRFQVLLFVREDGGDILEFLTRYRVEYLIQSALKVLSKERETKVEEEFFTLVWRYPVGPTKRSRAHPLSQPICQTSVRHACTRHVMGSHTILITARPERADCLLVQRPARRPPTSLRDAVSSTGPSRIKAECWPTAHPPPPCGRRLPDRK